MTDDILAAIEELGYGIGVKRLRVAAAELSAWYNAPDKCKRPFRWTREHYLCYVIGRMPATFQVAKRIFSDILSVNAAPIEPKTHLDLCSGPGTFVLAAREVFPSIERSDCLEVQPAFANLAHDTFGLIGESFNWLLQDVRSLKCTGEQFDLVTVGYALNEFDEAQALKILSVAYSLTKGLLVIVEPGTPDDYRHILHYRKYLIEHGMRVLAPCPHMLTCPKDCDDFTNKWCHFGVRVQRRKLHRLIKSGEAPFEDEKYTWLVASAQSAERHLPYSRVLDNPRKSNGKIDLSLCSHDGTLLNMTIRKHDRDRYKRAIKVSWGDSLF